MFQDFSIFNENGALLYGDSKILSKSPILKLIHDKYMIVAQYKDMDSNIAREIMSRFVKLHDVSLLERDFNKFLKQIEECSFGLISEEKEKSGNEVRIDVIEKLFCIMNEKGRVYKSIVQGEILIKGVKNKTTIVIEKPKARMAYCSDLVCKETLKDIKAELEFSGHQRAIVYCTNIEPPFKIIKVSANRYVFDVWNSNLKNIELVIPFSVNAKNVRAKVYYGSATVYKEYVMWKIPEITFKKTYIDIKCDNNEDTSRCIIANFNTEFYTGSGLKILSVSNGKRQPVWARSQFTTGNFEIRRVSPLD